MARRGKYTPGHSFILIRHVAYKMIQIFQKLKTWYHGEHIPYTLQEMMDRQQPIYPDSHGRELPDRFNPPLLARIINFICRCWLRRWMVFLPIIVGAIVALFIHFNSKSSSETQQEHYQTDKKTEVTR